MIIYLSPGDYHRFHSPYPIKVKVQREIDGRMRPVNMKSLLKNGGKVYEENGRKILHCYYNSALSSSTSSPNTTDSHPQENPNTNYYLGLVMVGALHVGDIVLSRLNK